MIANQGKNEIIGSLLALRAGLSVVSQENDAIKRTTGLAESAIQKKKAEKMLFHSQILLLKNTLSRCLRDLSVLLKITINLKM